MVGWLVLTLGLQAATTVVAWIWSLPHTHDLAADMTPIGGHADDFRSPGYAGDGSEGVPEAGQRPGSHALPSGPQPGQDHEHPHEPDHGHPHGHGNEHHHGPDASHRHVFGDSHDPAASGGVVYVVGDDDEDAEAAAWRRIALAQPDAADGGPGAPAAMQSCLRARPAGPAPLRSRCLQPPVPPPRA